ncbi:MAG TPA: hypothetical protein VMQ52_04235 [Candidatus Saccharimonadales bacterium]|jgi:hypothetical protein|nr:hypothetical protein [Candidatus Saccharimonadales bacterium]
MIVALFQWWYGAGLRQISRNISYWPSLIYRNFSVPLLAKHLFAPWRRIINPGGRGLQTQLRAALDNTVSRFVGFMSRILVIFTALIGMLLAIIAALIIVIIWPLLPLVIIYCIYRGIAG